MILKQDEGYIVSGHVSILILKGWAGKGVFLVPSMDHRNIVVVLPGG